MSSRERTLILKIDDTQLKEAIKKMQDVNGGGTSSGGGGKKSQGIGGLMKMVTQNPALIQGLGKLALILAGITIMIQLITKIADRIVESSPILQTMLKLFQTSITFILRPIGDFIGFFLRPFLIYFLRNVALPIYRLFGPIARGLGTFLGGNLFSNFTLQYDPDIDPFFGTNGMFVDVGKKITAWLDSLKLPTWGDLTTKVTGWLDSLKLPTWDNVVVAFTVFSRKLINFTIDILEKIRPFLPSMEDIWKVIGIFAEKLKPIIDSITPIMMKGLRGLRKVFNILIPLIGPIIEKIEPVIIGIADFVLDLVNPLKETLTTVFSIVIGFFKDMHALFDSMGDYIKIFFPGFSGHDHSGSTTVNSAITIFGDPTSMEATEELYNFGKKTMESLNNSIIDK